MDGYIIESLFPSGWRRTGELFWRLVDADAEADRLLEKRGARAIRILGATVHPEEVVFRHSIATGKPKKSPLGA